MAIFVDAQTDAADLASLVNDNGLFITRYGDNPKKSWLYMQDEFDTLLAGFEGQGDVAIDAINVDVVTVDAAKDAALTTISGYVSAIDTSKDNAIITIDSHVSSVDDSASAAISSINTNRVTVENAAANVDATIAELDSKYKLTAIGADGAWQSGIDFTAYNQYLVFSGTAYQPKPETSLPYTTGATPDLDDVQPVSVNVSTGIVNSDNSTVQQYIDGQQFQSIEDVKSYAKLSKLIGQRVKTKEYHTGTGYGGASYRVVDSSTVTPNSIDIIQGTVDSSAAIVLLDVDLIENYGAKKFSLGGAFLAAYDSSPAAARAAEVSRANNGEIKLLSNIPMAFKSQVDFRFIDLDLKNIDITVDNGISDAILMGDRANGGYSSNQEIGLVVRDGDSQSDPDLSKPIIKITGAKGQNIYIKACPYVLFYADTNSAVNDTDSSCAYSTFSGETVRVIELNTAPTTNGSLTQWINENSFNFKRVDKVIIDGTYDHNHNIFNTGTFEGESEILINRGSSNVFKNIRFEKYAGLADPVVTFGLGTWGNLIEQSWYSSYRRIFENRDEDLEVNELGRGNAVTRSVDYMLRNIDVFAVGRGTARTYSSSGLNLTSIKGFYAQPRDADSYKMDSAFRRILLTDFIPCFSGGGFNVEMDSTASVRVRWSAFNENFEPVNIDPEVNCGLDGSTSNINGNLATQNSNVNGSIFVVVGSDIKYLRLEVIAGNAGTVFDYLNVKAVLQHSYRRSLSEGSLMSNAQPTVSASPTMGFAMLGETVLNDADGTVYRCVSSKDLLTGSSSSGSTLNISSTSGISAGDIIGVKMSNSTHWTTCASVTSGTQLQLSLPLPEAVNGGVRVVVNRWL